MGKRSPQLLWKCPHEKVNRKYIEAREIVLSFRDNPTNYDMAAHAGRIRLNMDRRRTRGLVLFRNIYINMHLVRNDDPEAAQEVGLVDVDDADDDFRAGLHFDLARPFVLNSCRGVGRKIAASS